MSESLERMTMAENYYIDYTERTGQISKYSDLEKLAMPIEDAFGDTSTFQNAKEAMELYDGVLSEIGKLCANEVQPAAAEIDKTGVRLSDGEVSMPKPLEDNLLKARDLGVFAGGVSRKYGGYNLPKIVQTVALEMFAQACPNTALAIAAFSMSDFLEDYGTEEQKQTYIPKFISNEWRTSMALTEANAGSDLGQLRASGKKEGDRYVINGTKQFISYGNEHVTFALVRTDPHSSGLNGLSVMIVPRDIGGKPNFKIPKIEDKVCLHGSPTCEMIFENSIGFLMGPEGMGFKVMAELMNRARLGMGVIALGLATAARDEAKKYAKTRVTMGKPIIQHPMVADMIYEMEIEIRAMRALATEAAAACDWMRIYQKKGDEKNFRKWKKRFRRLTPLVKYMCAEKCVLFTRNALQIFGGYGVCKDYPAERFMRESLIHPIYEGTSQIQSLMVLKDTLKDVATQAGGFLGSLAGAWAESMITRDPIKSKVLQARNELNQAIRTVLMSIIKDKFKTDIEALKQQSIQDFLKDFSLQLLSPKTDLSYPFLCAERLTRIVCDYYALKCMADHYTPGDKDREKWILEFAELALPRMRMENIYMVNRLPSTLGYIKTQAVEG
ncbi:MAG: acyl-CoA dehydrogenase family protein [Deltaproteobacteria bacterium]|nr:acyl-CoA dehydrogenase family protein [Deltaproteobacteria bacterium]